MFTQLMTNAKRNALIATSAILISAAAMTGAAEAKSKNFHVHIGGPGFGVAIGHGGYYHGDYRYRPCRWLKRRAHMTGSPYWWRRYRRCMRRNYW
jgi:hypothetical protein